MKTAETVWLCQRKGNMCSVETLICAHKQVKLLQLVLDGFSMFKRCAAMHHKQEETSTCPSHLGGFVPWIGGEEGLLELLGTIS